MRTPTKENGPIAAGRELSTFAALKGGDAKDTEFVTTQVGRKIHLIRVLQVVAEVDNAVHGRPT